MDSTVHAHMDTCGFKREQVIRSDNVWLSEVMFGNRCGARVRGHPHGHFWDSKRDFLWSLAGGITPQQSESIHKIFTRIHKIFAIITQESRQKSTRNYARITTWNPTENSSNNFRFSCENTRIRMSH